MLGWVRASAEGPVSQQDTQKQGESMSLSLSKQRLNRCQDALWWESSWE